MGCGLCEKVCIANNPPTKKRSYENAYRASLLDWSDLKRSASGGAAYGFGMAQLSYGGIVYGVAFTGDFRSAEYIRVCEKKDLYRILNLYRQMEITFKNLFIPLHTDMLSHIFQENHAMSATLRDVRGLRILALEIIGVFLKRNQIIINMVFP